MGERIGGSDDPFMQQQRQPATGVDGSLYLTAMGGGNGWGLRRVDPASGNVLWNYSPWPVERDVASERRAGRLGLLLAEPQLPGVGDAWPGSHAGRSSTARSSITPQ